MPTGMCVPAVFRTVVPPAPLVTSKKTVSVPCGFPRNTKSSGGITTRVAREDEWGICAISPLVFSITNKFTAFYVSLSFTNYAGNINGKGNAR